jgi:SAM-dependent methyltransferase
LCVTRKEHKTDVSADLSLTGERTLPGIWHENYWFRRHEVVYRWLGPLVRGSLVVEAGCGEGYGAASLLVAGATSVVALDYDAGTVAHASTAYGLSTVRGNVVAMPLATACAGAVVGLQTVEHVWDGAAFVAECARLLAPGGLLALSTPNRLTFSPGLGRGERPLNPFHTRELDAEELAELVRPHLTAVTLLGVHHGSRLAAWERGHGPLADTLLGEPFDRWPAEVADLVRSVSADDFVVSDGCVTPVGTALDLLLLARKP